MLPLYLAHVRRRVVYEAKLPLMTRLIHIFAVRVILIIALITQAGCTSAFRKPTDKGIVMEKVSKFQVELDLILPPVFKLGENIRVTVKLTNKSNRTVYWGNVDGVRELGLVVRNNRGEEERKTPQGVKLLGESDRFHYKFINTPLEPGASKEWSIDISDAFSSNPGNYFISARMTLDSHAEEFFVAVTNVPFKIMQQ